PGLEPETLLQRVFPPMLATLVDRLPPDDAGWRLELKYDGFRGLAAISRGRAALWSRNALDLAGRFAGVARALAGLAVREAVLDGEIAVLDRKGASRFELLQQGHDAAALFFAFDLLWLDGEDLRGRP